MHPCLCHCLRDKKQWAQGAHCGWASLDPYYKVVPGEITIVTGESSLRIGGAARAASCS